MRVLATATCDGRVPRALCVVAALLGVAGGAACSREPGPPPRAEVTPLSPAQVAAQTSTIQWTFRDGTGRVVDRLKPGQAYEVALTVTLAQGLQAYLLADAARRRVIFRPTVDGQHLLDESSVELTRDEIDRGVFSRAAIYAAPDVPPSSGAAEATAALRTTVGGGWFNRDEPPEIAVEAGAGG